MVKSVSVARPQPAWGASVAIEDRYRPMIAQLEVMAARQPDIYRRRVFRRALLGYGYIGAVVLGIILCMAVVIAFMIWGGHLTALAVKPLIILAGVVFYILRSMWVKASPPEGFKITAADAPQLFAVIEDVRRKIRGPKTDAVYIIGDFNASIVQSPRFGVLGHRNILSLGLPLLNALSRDEVMAVIAHEYGHLAGAHGKMSAWVYRVRKTWQQLSEAFGTGVFGGVFGSFFKWYGPWFGAYSFVLARGNEYEADRASADVVGASVAAQALTRVSVESHRYDMFWATLFKRAGTEAQVYPHSQMGAYFVQPMAQGDVQGALKTALSEATDIHDTHPCLNDRLKALGQDLPELPPITRTAASELLSAAFAAKLAEQLDADWWEKAGDYWSERREGAERDNRQLAELSEKAGAGSLTVEETWDYQTLLENSGDKAGALDIARRRLSAKPEDLSARIAFGRMQLETDDEQGLEVLQRTLDEGIKGRTQLFVLDTVLDYYKRVRPEDAELPKYQAQFDKALEVYQAIQQELDSVSEACEFERSGLDEAAVAAIRTAAAKSPDFKVIWVARRRLRADPEASQLILLYDSGNSKTGEIETFTDEMLDILRQHDNALVVRYLSETRWLKTRIDKIEGARILKR